MTAAELAALRRAYPRVFGLAPWERARRASVAVLALAVLGVSCWRVAPTAEAFWAGVGRIGFLVGFMFPPSAGGALGALLHALAETLAMAFLGTWLAAVLALPLGFLGARNVLRVALLHFGLRRILDGLRGVDSLIWALIFVAAVGMGPFAGILALAVPDTGTLAKLFAEAIENADRRQVEAVRAAGGASILEARFGLLPQVLPVMLGHVLYFFESNVRSASILGVVGAGGIGLALSERIRINNWDEIGFLILLILATVGVIDGISGRARRAIIRA